MKSSRKHGVKAYAYTGIDEETLQLLDMIDRATEPSAEIEQIVIKVYP